MTESPGINVRDIASVGGGRYVKPGVVVRSAAPLFFDKPGLTHLEEALGVRAAVDLRGRDEVKLLPYHKEVQYTDSRLLPGQDGWHHVDLVGPAVKRRIKRKAGWLTQAWWSLLHISGYKKRMGREVLDLLGMGNASSPSGQALEEMYSIILEDACPEVKTAVETVAEHVGTGAVPVLVHCSVGKDRTGVLVALLHLLSGVPEEHIVEDYSVSEANLESHQYIVESQDESIRELVSQDILYRSPPKAMHHVLDLVSSMGGVEVYLTERCGVSQEVVLTLKQALMP